MLNMVRGGGESTLNSTLRASSSADQREPSAGRWDWPERFKPTTVKELEMGVNYTYTRRLKDWINKALRAHAESRDTPGFRPHVLALCGVSGCGKSTMVEVLCREMKVKVMEWTEDEWDMDLKENATVSYSAGRRGRFVGDNYKYSSANDAYGDSEVSRYESRLDELNDLERFVRQSAYPQLSLTGAGSSSAKAGGGTTTAMHPRKKAKGLGKAGNSTVLVDDSDFEFDDPSPRKGKGLSKRKKGLPPKKTVEDSDDDNDGGRDGKKPRIVLMHDLPHLMASYSNARSGGASFGTDSGGDARNVEKAEALAALFPSFRDPVIMIVSDVSEKDDVEFAKRRFMPEKVRHMVELETIYQNKATTLNIAKTLRRILSCSENKNTRKVLQERLSAAPGQKSVENFLLELSESCLGDLRHAVLQLSFISAVQEAEVQEDEEGMVEVKTGSADAEAVIDLTQSDHSDDEGGGTGRRKGNQHKPVVDVKDGRERDLSYSSLHSIAKICNASLDSLARFLFDVDTVLASSTMEAEMMFSFIQHNIVKSLINSQACERHGLPLQDAVRELNELEQVVAALGYCSDLDMYVHRKYDPSSLHERSNNIYPECYMSSLLARLGGVSRTVGSMERMDNGKVRGASKQITLMERPKSLDLRSRKRNMLSALEALNGERFREARGGADAAMVVIAPSEVATTMAPLMSTMLALRQRQAQRSAAVVYGVPHHSSSSCAAGGGGGMMSEKIKARVQVFRELAGLQDLGFKRLPARGDEDEEQEQEQPMAIQRDEIEDSD